MADFHGHPALLTRCTTEVPTPRVRATFKIPVPFANSRLIAASLLLAVSGRPIGRPDFGRASWPAPYRP
jgi:hypothetical protein